MHKALDSLKKLLKKIDSKKHSDVTDLATLHTLSVNGEYSAVAVNNILFCHSDILREIENEVTFKASDKHYGWDSLYFKVIANYVSYAHLLPATEDYHHARASGLLEHSLEVALWAYRSSRRIMLDPVDYEDKERLRQERWRYGVFVAALSHEAGKIFNDMQVTDCNSGNSWSPANESLTQWLSSQNVEKYRVQFSPAKIHRMRDEISVLLLDKVLTKEAREYLANFNSEVYLAILKYLSNCGNEQDYIERCVREADRGSTQKDVANKKRVNVKSSAESVVTIFSQTLQSLRPRARINEKDGDVFVINKRLYIAESFMDKVLCHARDAGFEQMPRSRKVLISVLEQKRILVRDNPDFPYSKFKLKGTQTSQIVYGFQWSGIFFGHDKPDNSVPGELLLSKEGDKYIFTPDGVQQEMAGAKHREENSNSQQNTESNTPSHLKVSHTELLETELAESEKTQTATSSAPQKAIQHSVCEAIEKIELRMNKTQRGYWDSLKAALNRQTPRLILEEDDRVYIQRKLYQSLWASEEQRAAAELVAAGITINDPANFQNQMQQVVLGSQKLRCYEVAHPLREYIRGLGEVPVRADGPVL